MAERTGSDGHDFSAVWLFMDASGKREIVIEFERVELIRKRARTSLMYCTECGRESDCVSTSKAAELFAISEDELLTLISPEKCHINYVTSSRPYLCIGSLLNRMNRQARDAKFRLRGDTRK